jgi:hypothetical protein
VVAQYPAYVTIDGEAITAGWDGSAVAAVADIAITWGRSDIYSKTEPASLRLNLVDPTGDWATDNSLVGKLVVVGRTSPDRVMFRGRITDIAPQRRTIIHPDGGPAVVYIVEVLAVDKLADLAQAHPLGPGTGLVAIYGIADGFWIQARPAARVDAIKAQGGSAIVASIEVPDIPAALPIAGAGYLPMMNWHPVSHHMGLLDLIQELYYSIPLGHVNYNADTDGIEVGRSATSAGMQLALTAGVITSAPITGKTIESSQLITDKYPQLRSTVAYSIDLVQAVYILNVTTDYPWEPALAEALTELGAGHPARRTLTINSAFIRYGVTTQDGGTGDLYAAELASKTVDLVDDVNGRFSAPPLRFDFRRFSTGDVDLDDILLATIDKSVPLYLKHSMLNHLPNFGPQFQLIGGTIAWMPKVAGSQLDAGWVVDMKLAPATGAIDNVTISNLVTNATPAMSDFDPELSLAELGDVTIGLA